MAIKKLSTLSGVDDYRVSALNLSGSDIFHISLSGTPGGSFSDTGRASAGITYSQLAEALSATLKGYGTF